MFKVLKEGLQERLQERLQEAGILFEEFNEELAIAIIEKMASINALNLNSLRVVDLGNWIPHSVEESYRTLILNQWIYVIKKITKQERKYWQDYQNYECICDDYCDDDCECQCHQGYEEYVEERFSELTEEEIEAKKDEQIVVTNWHVFYYPLGETFIKTKEAYKQLSLLENALPIMELAMQKTFASATTSTGVSEVEEN